MMEVFTTLTGTAAPLLQDDLNTDQIMPLARSEGLKPDYAANLFRRWRFNEDGSENTEFVLNRPQFRDTRILVSGINFGCGSSREGAVWSMAAYGIRCVVARSFADIFRENCLRNSVLTVVLPPGKAEAFEALVIDTDGAEPFTVDLSGQRISCPGGSEFAFDIGAAEKTAMLEGLDDIGMTLKHADDVAGWEKRMKQQHGWLQQAADSRL
jgi:3-isopropylmalate dehydratase small subunit